MSPDWFADLTTSGTEPALRRTTVADDEDAAPPAESADAGADSGDDFTSRPPLADSSSRATAPRPDHLDEVRQALAAFSEAVSTAVLEDTDAHPDQGPSWKKALDAFVADWQKSGTPAARQSQLYAQRHLGKARNATRIPVLRPERRTSCPLRGRARVSAGRPPKAARADHPYQRAEGQRRAAAPHSLQARVDANRGPGH